jgi:hypothetical protein
MRMMDQKLTWKNTCDGMLEGCSMVSSFTFASLSFLRGSRSSFSAA